MFGGAKQLVMLLLFLGLVGGIVVYKYVTATSAGTEQFDPKEALKNYGFYLTEVSKECLIDFVHRAPEKLDARLDHIMPIIASMGASVSVVDFDRDGSPDLYVVNSAEGSKNRLYRNKGDGTFEDVAEKLGVADLNREGDGVCMGAVWGDFDNDGYEDLLVYRWGKIDLYHNDQGKGFTRVTAQAGLPAWMNANTAVWLDYDRDGWLDLFIPGYWDDALDLWHLKDTRIMPDSFQFATNGGKKHLLRNRGMSKDGKEWLGFEDVTEKMGIKGQGWALAVAATDLRGTGYPDIVIANDYGVNEFYANHEGKQFVEVGKKTGVGYQSKSGMSVSFGDVFNTGRFAVYVTNISEPGILLQGNNLWVPDPGATGEDLSYQNLAGSLRVEMGGWSWGAQFGDLNNDGWQDLLLTAGYISADRNREYWHDYSHIPGAHKEFIIDAANWPAMKGRSLSGYQQKCVWLNSGGKFTDVCRAVGVSDTSDGRAVALVDLWNRGVLDVVLANQKGPLLVYKNTVAPGRHWVQFELEGTKGNRSAIGAQVKLYRGGKVQVQEVSGGNGYASQNQRRVHFGLGESGQIEKVVIHWPSGQVQEIAAPKADVLHKLKEPQ